MTLASLAAEILFVGHSLIGPDLPPMVEAAERMRGHEISAQYQITNGAPLRWNWDKSFEAEGVDGRRALASGKIGTLIVTESLPLADQIQWNDSAGYARRFYELGLDANPQMQGFMLETWHDMEMGMDDWRKALVTDVEKWRGIVDEVNANLPEGATPMRMIPAGQALNLLAQDIDEGRVPGLTSVRDLFTDNIHSNDRGRYLTAMVVVAALGDDPAGLPARLGRRARSLDTVVTDQMAVAMQSAARRAVEAERLSEAERLASAPATATATATAQASTPETAPPPMQTAEVTGAEPIAPPVAQPAPQPEAITLGGVSRKGIGFGLNGLADWTSQQPFLDVIKTARPWTGHLPGQWGGYPTENFAKEGWLDENGWLKDMPPGLESAALLMLTDLPEDAGGVAGRYRITWQGKGKFTLAGRAQNTFLGDHIGHFDFTPGGGLVEIKILSTDPADPLRNFSVVREDRAALLDAGQLFNPDWLARIRGTELVRFMDWAVTNNSTLAQVADRPRIDDYTWVSRGVPPEIMVALANELDADAWFTMPHLSDDALVRDYATVARDGLEPGRRAWIEYSNEVWNFTYAQAAWADQQARALWGRDNLWLQFYAKRASEVADIWAETFDNPERLVRVMATQTGWIGLEDQILRPDRLGLDTAQHFDAYAITGYFSGRLGEEDKRALVQGWLAESRAMAEAQADAQGLTHAARDDFVTRHRFDAAIPRAIAELRDGSESGNREDTLAALLGEVMPYHRDVAKKNGLALAMYEGGTHVVGIGPLVDDQELTEFLIALNYSDGMGALYQELLAGWAALTDTPFNAFVDVSAPTKWGSWGALRHLGDDSARWRALSQDDAGSQ